MFQKTLNTKKNKNRFLKEKNWNTHEEWTLTGLKPKVPSFEWLKWENVP